MPRRRHADDLRAASKLAVDATKRVTALIQAMHKEIASGPTLLGRPLAPFAELYTKIVYGSVSLTTSAVGVLVDALLEELAPLLGESELGDKREIVRAALNAVVGDYLQAVKNPLAIEMAMRVERASERMLVLVHGSGMSDRQWLRHGHDHGAVLADALGCGRAYVHYNTGLHVSENGERLSEHLDALLCDEIVLIGYSMGGLVARAAIHAGKQAAWRRKLKVLVTIATPHHGAPLERGGSVVHALLGVHRYSAPIGRLARVRSKGITDLRFGNVRKEDWQDHDRFALHADPRVPTPLPADVACFAIAGTRSAAEEKRLHSDGLVPVKSALGEHAAEERTLAFAKKAIVYGTNHLELLADTRVSEQVLAWLRGC
ncbi:MAG: alpha/beta fold hydrolase [Deltaproteobacteria bacterium]|nr:alpha/beta fold hydrolase [Deltaproteobacteria bacterium]